MRLNRIRAEARASLASADREESESLDSIASALQAYPYDLAVEQYSEAARKARGERQLRRREMAHQFITEYIGVLLMASHEPAALAASLHTDVRQACLAELSQLGKDLPKLIENSVLFEQEARCWGLAEEAERNLNPSVARRSDNDVAVNSLNLPKFALFALDRLRTITKAIISKIAETRRAYLQDVIRNGLVEYREALNDANDVSERDRQDAAGEFVAEYISLLLAAGNSPGSLAKSMQTVVREACVTELNDLGLDLPNSVLEALLQQLEGRCWGLAEQEKSEISQTDKPTTEIGKILYGTSTPQEVKEPTESHKGKKPVRRSEKYEAIDKALREFAEARPKSHEEVFRLLDDRRVAIPNRMPFKSAGGWLKGVQQNRRSASEWLSQAWGRLGLPAFPRGPKK